MRPTVSAARRSTIPSATVTVRVLCCAVLVAVSPGCVLIPLPEHGLVFGLGEISESAADALQPGVTTREDVLLSFGEPAESSDDQKTLVYYWSVWAGVIATYGGGNGYTRNYSYFLDFDDDGVLVRSELSGHSQPFDFVGVLGRLDEWLCEGQKEM